MKSLVEFIKESKEEKPSSKTLTFKPSNRLKDAMN